MGWVFTLTHIHTFLMGMKSGSWLFVSTYFESLMKFTEWKRLLNVINVLKLNATAINLFCFSCLKILDLFLSDFYLCKSLLWLLVFKQKSDNFFVDDNQNHNSL